jgi:hypothetical protein
VTIILPWESGQIPCDRFIDSRINSARLLGRRIDGKSRAGALVPGCICRNSIVKAGVKSILESLGVPTVLLMNSILAF